MDATLGTEGVTHKIQATLSTLGVLRGTMTATGAIDVYTKTDADQRFAQKGTTLASYGIGDAYTKDQVDAAIAQCAASIEYTVVDILPTTGVPGQLYFVPSASDPSVYDEYIYVNDHWVLANKISIDLSQYMRTANAYTKTEADAKFAEKSTTLAGYGIVNAYTASEANVRFATKATTLAGYGIANAYSKAESDARYAPRASTLSGYGISDAYSRVETDQAIATALSEITTINMEVVESLPTTGAAGTFYLVANGSSENSIYDEWIFINSRWEKIGTTELDLTDYLTVNDVVGATEEQIDDLLEL